MKLLHTLFAGAAALLLLGVTAATTLPADDGRFSEAIKENEGSHVEEPGFCPLVWVQLMYDPAQWIFAEVQNEQSAFCNMDAPSASVAASAAADDIAATADTDIDDAVDLPPDSAARPFCPFVQVQHLYNPMQWEVAELQDEPRNSPTDKLGLTKDAPTAAAIKPVSPGSPAQCVPRHYGWWISNVDVCSVDGAKDGNIDKTDGDVASPDDASAGGGEEKVQDEPVNNPTDTLHVNEDAPTAATIKPVSPGSPAQCVPRHYGWWISNVGVCSVDGAKDDDNITTATDGDVTIPDDASTGGGREALHDNDPTTDTTETMIGDNDPPISTEGEGVGSVPTNSSVAENDVAPVGLESILRLQTTAGGDPSVRVVLSEGSDVEPPTLTLFELGTDKTTGLTPTKVVQLTADVKIRAVSGVAFTISKGEESWVFNARDREERDQWTDALVHAVDEAATPDDGDMASGKGSATSLSGILRQNKGLLMKHWELTLTGSVLTAYKVETKTCKVVQLTAADVQVQAVSLVSFKVWKGKESWVFVARDREERDSWTNALLHAMEEAAAPDDGDMASAKGSATPPSDVLNLKTRWGMKPRRVTLTGPALTTCKLAKTGTGTEACEDLKLDALSDAVHVNDENGGKGPTRFLFRVTEHSLPTTRAWIFDAGSADERVRWVAAIKAAADGTKTEGEEGDAEEEASASPTPSPVYPPSRGWELGPKDKPLFPEEYMLNILEEQPTTLEVTEIGDLLLSPGRLPDRAQEPLWAHRMTGTFGGRAIGGLGCALEDRLQRLISRDAIPVTLSVKNGRWRVGRGMLCTLGRSPAPKGSLRRFLPWDERDREVREGSLMLLDGDSVVITLGEDVEWDSLTAA